MSIVAAIGSLSLGIVVGWLVRYFIRRFKSFTPKALGSVVSLIVGGAITSFLEADKSVWWFYPIGLLVGFAAYTVIALWAIRNKKDSEAIKNAGDIGILYDKTDAEDIGILYEKTDDGILYNRNK